MAFGAREDQTEPATPKRREETRERGQIARSREFSSALTLLAAVVALWYLGPSMWKGLALQMQTHLQEVAQAELHIANVQPLIFGAFTRPISLIAPVLGICLVIGVLANVLQVGLLFTASPLIPRWSRLDPAAGVSRFLSPLALMELVKAIVKLAIIGVVAYFSLRANMGELFLLGEQGVTAFFARLSEMAATLLGRCGVALLVLGGLDYLWQRWEYEQSMKMSKMEVKEEMRQREADPKVKARIRSMQREMGRRRMMAAVPKATVVITNPRHLAVALAYERGDTPAPQVVARGAGYLAERIKALARTAGVPIVENKPLARMLYHTLEVGEFIPVTLYKAVAQILAYVYSLQGKRSDES